MDKMVPIAVFLNDRGAIDRVRFLHWSCDSGLQTTLQGVSMQMKAQCEGFTPCNGTMNIVSRVVDLTLEEICSLTQDNIQLRVGVTVVDYKGDVHRDTLQMIACWRNNSEAIIGIFVDWRGAYDTMLLDKMAALCRKCGIELGVSSQDIASVWKGASVFDCAGLEYASEENRSKAKSRVISADLFNLPYFWYKALGELWLTGVSCKDFVVPDIFEAVRITNNRVVERLCALNVIALSISNCCSLKELVFPNVVYAFIVAQSDRLKFKLPEEVVPLDNKPATFQLGVPYMPLKTDLVEIDQSRYVLATQGVYVVCPNLKKAVLSIPNYIPDRGLCSFRDAYSLNYISFVRRTPYVNPSCFIPIVLHGVRDLVLDWKADINNATLRLRVDLCDDSSLTVIRVMSCRDIQLSVIAQRLQLTQRVLFILGNNVQICKLAASDDTNSWDLYWSYNVSSQSEESDMLKRIKGIAKVSVFNVPLPQKGFIVKENF